MTSAGPTPENEGIDPELQAAVESAFEEVPDDVREGLAQGSPEGAADFMLRAAYVVVAAALIVTVVTGLDYVRQAVQLSQRGGHAGR